jgi:hypothetical protein
MTCCPVTWCVLLTQACRQACRLVLRRPAGSDRQPVVLEDLVLSTKVC